MYLGGKCRWVPLMYEKVSLLADLTCSSIWVNRRPSGLRCILGTKTLTSARYITNS